MITQQKKEAYGTCVAHYDMSRIVTNVTDDIARAHPTPDDTIQSQTKLTEKKFIV